MSTSLRPVTFLFTHPAPPCFPQALNKYFREVEKQRKVAVQEELMQEAKDLMHSASPRGERAEGTHDAAAAADEATAPAEDKPKVLVKPYFRTLDVPDSYFTKLTGKVRHPCNACNACNVRSPARCDDPRCA